MNRWSSIHGVATLCSCWVVCLQVRNIFPRISLHDLPYRRTMRTSLLQIFLKKTIFHFLHLTSWIRTYSCNYLALGREIMGSPENRNKKLGRTAQCLHKGFLNTATIQQGLKTTFESRRHDLFETTHHRDFFFDTSNPSSLWHFFGEKKTSLRAHRRTSRLPPTHQENTCSSSSVVKFFFSTSTFLLSALQ